MFYAAFLAKSLQEKNIFVLIKKFFFLPGKIKDGIGLHTISTQMTTHKWKNVSWLTL